MDDKLDDEAYVSRQSVHRWRRRLASTYGNDAVQLLGKDVIALARAAGLTAPNINSEESRFFERRQLLPWVEQAEMRLGEQDRASVKELLKNQDEKELLDGLAELLESGVPLKILQEEFELAGRGAKFNEIAIVVQSTIDKQEATQSFKFAALGLLLIVFSLAAFYFSSDSLVAIPGLIAFVLGVILVVMDGWNALVATLRRMLRVVSRKSK
ncbi:hypothetical protein OAS86_01855 [Gammaproteobacteria bacterium]|nr:hypothetical protein [Gammaproteobacteria bacterium]